MIKMKSLLLICLIQLLVLFVNGQTCECTIQEVENGTVSPCATTIGTVVNVSSFAAFQTAVNQANNTGGNMTILFADGTYQIATTAWYPYITASNVVFRSLSGNRDNVILTGSGMQSVYPNVESGFYIVGNNVTIADLTIKDLGNHGIATHGDNLLIHNVKIQDTYEQMIKGTAVGDGADNGIVQCSLLEYTAGVAPNFYTAGIDIHSGNNWLVSDNVFKNIASPALTLAEHAIHFWNNAGGNIIERNIIVNCDRGIGFGLGSSANVGGIIRNNMIYNDGTALFDDVGIGLESSPDTKVYNNTIFIDYPNAIEYRFTSTTNVDIANNLCNQLITSRDGGQATLTSNFTTAQSSWFQNLGNGNLRLNDTVANVVNAGINIANVTDDIDKTARPQTAMFDIGAHELAVNNPPINLPSLISLNNLSYEGAFIIPATDIGESDANYAAGAITYNNVNHSLFFAGYRIDAAVAELAIPALVNSTDLTLINTATFLQGYKKVLNLNANGNPQNIDQISGLGLYNGKLLINAVEYYDAPANNTHTTLVLEDANNLATSAVNGYYALAGAAHTAGWISNIPTALQTQFGGPYLAGNSSKYPINGRSPMGISCFAFNPADLTGTPSGIIPTTTLLDYDLSDPLYSDYDSYFNSNYNIVQLNGSTFPGHTFADANATFGTNNLWTEESQASYGFIIPGTDTYFTVGSSGGHNSGIGYKPTQNNGNVCGGPCPYDAADVYNYYWLWDVNDLLAVKNGTVNAYDVRPYEYGEFNVPFQTDYISNTAEFHPIVGGTFDADSSILYLTIYDGAPTTNIFARNPVIVAYKIEANISEEICDGIDNNNNGQIDEHLVNTWVGPANANWYDNPNYWSLQHFPNTCNHVIIDAPNQVSITNGKLAEGYSLDVKIGAELIMENDAQLFITQD